MAEYTVFTAVAVAVVVGLELFWFRTGIFVTAQYWIAMVIIFGFQILVDGWLTKLSNPIVIYDPTEMSGLRIPWDIPIEDFGFAFAMVTLAILLWRRGLARQELSSTRSRDHDQATKR
jgi:lycopene cyclase domain-containing protein